MGVSGYNTVAKEAVLAFFRENPDRQFTCEQIFFGINEKESEGLCGKSTVYRLIGKLCKDGVIKKFYGENESTARYQYASSDMGCEHHLHMKCTKCGTVYHLECEKSSFLMEHVSKEHGFKINSRSSLLYGECKSCNN